MAMTVPAARAIPVLEAPHTLVPAALLTPALADRCTPAPVGKCMQDPVVARTQVQAAPRTPVLVVARTQDQVAPVTPGLAVAHMQALAGRLTPGLAGLAERVNSASSLEQLHDEASLIPWMPLPS